ncbi:MAG: DUF1593 domain-containing protein [Cytophagales bacterium]|nr:DUF1593 domain-containing protein [Cytophagales bacterium]
MNQSTLLYLAFGLQTFFCSCQAAQSKPEPEALNKPRLLITTDIGGDPDDRQSLVRLLVSANEFDLVGLVASAAGTPGELDTSAAYPHLIEQAIDAYAQVYELLIQHDSAYPSPQQLKAVVKVGNPLRGREAVGEGRETEGSRFIREQMEMDTATALNIAIWGGQTDLAQALFDLRQKYGSQEYVHYIKHVRIYDIGDQDKIYDLIKATHPSLFYILNRAAKGRDIREAAFRGMYLEGDMSTTSREWIVDHVKTGHGPLGALYPDKTWTAPNPHGCLKEGDTPSWFYFLANGLHDPSKPWWGGWGGRFESDTALFFRDAQDRVDSTTSSRATVWRWRSAFQNDFAARMDWCISAPDQANHHPQLAINGHSAKTPLYLRAEPGKTLHLDASASTDPDGDSLKFAWWVYAEASRLDSIPALTSAHDSRTALKLLPEIGTGEIHLILEVKDNGSPALTAYKRVVIAVEH